MEELRASFGTMPLKPMGHTHRYGMARLCNRMSTGKEENATPFGRQRLFCPMPGRRKPPFRVRRSKRVLRESRFQWWVRPAVFYWRASWKPAGRRSLSPFKMRWIPSMSCPLVKGLGI